jgi:hypothetical protein
MKLLIITAMMTKMLQMLLSADVKPLATKLTGYFEESIESNLEAK